MGLFGKSFAEKVQDALGQVRDTLGVATLDAQIDGKTVTLTGTVETMEMKAQVMQEFNARVATANTVNQVRVVQAPAVVATVESPPPAAAPEAEPTETIHEVVRGDTLSGLAKTYYGKASMYMKIFEANRDQLDNPDLIKVGQKLRIPKP